MIGNTGPRGNTHWVGVWGQLWTTKLLKRYISPCAQKCNCPCLQDCLCDSLSVRNMMGILHTAHALKAYPFTAGTRCREQNGKSTTLLHVVAVIAVVEFNLGNDCIKIPLLSPFQDIPFETGDKWYGLSGAPFPSVVGPLANMLEPFWVDGRCP